MRYPVSVAAILAVLLSVTALPVLALQTYRCDLSWGSLGPNPGEFNAPIGICTDGSTLYVVDRFNHRVQTFTLDGVFQSTWGTGGSGADNLSFPWGIRVKPATGAVFISDAGNDRIMKRAADWSYVGHWGSNGAGAEQFNTPLGMCLNGNTLYIADRFNNRIDKWSLAGAYLGAISFTGDWALSEPGGVACDGTYLYITDTNHGRIIKATLAGAPVASLTGDYSFPYNVTYAEGRLYIADTLHDRVVKTNLSGTQMAIIGAPGSGPGQLDIPDDVAVDNLGRVYVTDSGNHRVNRYHLNHAPTVPTNAWITPKPAYDGDTLVGHAGGSTDADPGDAVRYGYRWYKRPNAASDWTLVAQTRKLAAAETTVGYLYKVQARARDGLETSGWRDAAAVRIQADTAVPALTVTARQAPNGAIALSLSLAAAASVDGQLCNLAGRTVALVPARHLPAGAATLMLPALSAHGTKLPTGRYLLRLRARSEAGLCATQLVPLALR